MTGTFVVPLGQAANENAPGQAKKACKKNNNGIGNNYDVEYTLRNKTFTIRIDPGNNGQMNKFRSDLAAASVKPKYTQTEIDSAVAQIYDAEKNAKNGNNTNCPSGSVGTDYSTLYATISDFPFYRAASDPTIFHNTTYPNGKKGVDAFQQFVNTESSALNLDQLNARRLDSTKLRLNQAQDLKVYFINEGASYRNQLQLVTSGGTSINGLVFRDGSEGSGPNVLRIGDYVGLGTVAAGTTLDFRLRANGANNSNPDVWYADVSKNVDKQQHVIAYEYEGYLILAWEDLYGGGDKDYNDIVFAIDIGKSNLAAIPTEPAVNKPPVANNDTAITPYNTPITIDVMANDSDPEKQAINITSVTSLTGATVQVANGKVVYTPKLNYHGTDTFTYTIADTSGATNSAIVTVNVNPKTNNPPTAGNDSATTAYATPVTINVKANDSDPDGDPLTITLNQPLNGTVNLSGDQVVYTPNTGYFGTDTFTYRVADPDGVSAEATVTVTVTPKPNGSPEAQDDISSTDKNQSVIIPVLSNDSDPDGDTLTVTVGNSSNGKTTVNSDNTVTYTPNSGYVGNDSFTYTISDGKGGIATANVTVTVNSTNNPPESKLEYAD
ncbi:Ig-like domain-containing protein [Stanieria cyanosphaera]|nr:Ig-like domain-containing protein [Stanieria cyanosphaera]